MAIVVEDGTGSLASESYVSVADAVTYATNHGLVFDGDFPSSEAALRGATAFIDYRYRLRFPGIRTNRRLQALEWPRSGAFYYTSSYLGESPYFVDPSAFYPFDIIDEHTIPPEIINATCVAATIELAAPGTLVTGGSSSTTTGAVTGGAITKLKAGSVEIDYSAGSPLTISSSSSGRVSGTSLIELPVLGVLSALLSPATMYTARAVRA